jgi:hypothetical protein
MIPCKVWRTVRVKGRRHEDHRGHDPDEEREDCPPIATHVASQSE